MPVYQFQCTECRHQFDEVLRISDRKKPETEPCPVCDTTGKIEQVIGAPLIGDPMRQGSTVKGGFADVLRKIHDKTYKSNLNLKFN